MTSNTPNPAFSNLLNSTAFDGTTESDFYRLGTLPDSVKKSLINYSSQDFEEIKESLVNYVKAVYPEDYNSFAESDLGMMFLELVAYVLT